MMDIHLSEFRIKGIFTDFVLVFERIMMNVISKGLVPIDDQCKYLSKKEKLRFFYELTNGRQNTFLEY